MRKIIFYKLIGRENQKIKPDGDPTIRLSQKYTVEKLKEYRIIGLYILCSKYLQLVRFRGKQMREAAFLWPAAKILITEIVTSGYHSMAGCFAEKDIHYEFENIPPNQPNITPGNRYHSPRG